MSADWRLTDVIVGFGLVSFLFLLAVGGLQKSRADSRRTACADNVRALTRGMIEHESLYGGLPHRRTTKPFYRGFGVTLLPFIGQQGLADKYHSDVHFFEPANQAVVSQHVGAFQCPDSPQRRTIEIADMTGRAVGTIGAASDYFLPNSAKDEGLPRALQSNQRTALLDDRMMPSSACVDGKSQTLLIFEMAGRPDHWIAGVKQAERKQAHAGWWGAWAAWNATQVWSYTRDGHGYQGPCTVNCNNEHGPYSFHEGGAYASFVDGSVKLLSTQLDRYVLFALVTRDGRELVADVDF